MSHLIERQKERRFRVYEEAAGFRSGPRVMTRAQARGDWLGRVMHRRFFPRTLLSATSHTLVM